STNSGALGSFPAFPAKGDFTFEPAAKFVKFVKFVSNSIFIERKSDCACLYFSETLTHVPEGGRFDPDTRKLAEPAQGLGRSGELAGLLRHLLAIDLWRRAKSGALRCRSARHLPGERT